MEKIKKQIRTIIAVFAVIQVALAWIASPVVSAQSADPMPSWNDTAAKKAFVEFVFRIRISCF